MASAEVDSRSTMMLLLHVAIARDSSAKIREAGEPARVATVSPSQTPRIAARLWAAISSSAGVASEVLLSPFGSPGRPS